MNRLPRPRAIVPRPWRDVVVLALARRPLQADFGGQAENPVAFSRLRIDCEVVPRLRDR